MLHVQPPASKDPGPAISPTPIENRYRFRKEDDVIVTREFAAKKAHIAPNGETRERFEIADANVNGSKRLKHAVTWMCVQDRLKRLQDRFDQQEAIAAKLSGVGGEIGGLEEFRSVMKEARHNFLEARKEKSRMQE